MPGGFYLVPESKQDGGTSNFHSLRGWLVWGSLIRATWRNSIERWQPVGFKGNWLQKHPADLRSLAFVANGIITGL